MNYCPVIFGPDGQTDRRTESDAYEPIVQSAQVGSKMNKSEGAILGGGAVIGGGPLLGVLRYLHTL